MKWRKEKGGRMEGEGKREKRKGTGGRGIAFAIRRNAL